MSQDQTIEVPETELEVSSESPLIPYEASSLSPKLAEYAARMYLKSDFWKIPPNLDDLKFETSDLNILAIENIDKVLLTSYFLASYRIWKRKGSKAPRNIAFCKYISDTELR